MSLYIPSFFSGADRTQAERLIAAHPFATLLTSIDGEEPCVTHLPLLCRDECLYGHMARPNGHWQRFAAGRTLAIFHGPHAYVSPRWYPQPERHVPTWNYATVHVTGVPELLEGESVQACLLELTAHFDPTFTATAARVAQLLPGIVAFRLPMTRLDIKLKLSQNRTDEERAALRAQLSASEDAQARLVAQWMQTP